MVQSSKCTISQVLSWETCLGKSGIAATQFQQIVFFRYNNKNTSLE